MALGKINLETISDGELNWKAKRDRNDERLSALAAGKVAGVANVSSVTGGSSQMSYVSSDYDNTPITASYVYHKGKFYYVYAVSGTSVITLTLYDCNQSTGAIGTATSDISSAWLNTAVAFYESWDAIGGSGGSTNIPTQYYLATQPMTVGQTVFNLPWSYTTGAHMLKVHRNGVYQQVGVGFTETSGTSVTLTTAITATNEELVFETFGGSGNVSWPTFVGI